MLSPMAAGGVELHRVSRSFGAIDVLRDIEAQFPPGSITEIVGDNGAGKSSLLRILAGTLTPTSGSVTIAGSPPGRGKAGLVPAGDRALYWRLTGRQELEFFARVTGVPRADAAVVASEAAEMLEVEHLMDRQIGTFSTGQRRRLMVARSLVGLAPTLLLDEPYADLDEKACSVVESAVRAWTRAGGVVIWASPTSGGGPSPDDTYRLAGGGLARA
jgi:ABC-type multidrug transport system ATPase subunit